MKISNSAERNRDNHERNTEDDIVDILTEQLGFGKWTIFMMASFICWGLVLPYFSLGAAFLNPNVDHWCQEKNITEIAKNYTGVIVHFLTNSTNIWEEKDGELVRSQCEEYDVSKWLENVNQNKSYHNEGNWNETTFPKKSCSAWEFDTSTFTSTVSMDWNLVCNSAGISPFFQSFYYFGVTVGEPLLGFISDKYGRRWVMRRIWFIFVLASVTSVVSPNYSLLLAMRFILGIVHASCSVAFILLMEACPSKYRTLVGLWSTISFSIAGASFGCLAYFIRDWRHLQAVCIISGVIHLLYLPFMDESPRWLLYNNRTEEGIAVFKKAARWHNVELQIPANLIDENFTANKLEVQETNQTDDNGCYNSLMGTMKQWLKEYLTLVRTPVMRRITLTMLGCWFMVGLSFWGISLAGGTYSSNPFLYMILQSVTEIPSTILIIPILRYIGRKTVLSFTFFGCAVSMFIVLAIPKDMAWTILILAIAGKLCITAAYNLIYLYTGELFPTCIRSRGFNMSSMMARIASISSPFVISSLANSYAWMPTVIFGTAATVGTVLSCLLPESRGNPLLDTVEQVEELYGEKKRQSNS